MVAKVNSIDTSGFVSRTKYNTDKSDLRKKIGDTDKKNPTDYKVKITRIESKIPISSGLATSAAFAAAENKIPDVSNLVKNK